MSCLQVAPRRLALAAPLAEAGAPGAPGGLAAVQAVAEGLALSRHISAASQTASAQIAALHHSLALHSSTLAGAAAAAAASSSTKGQGSASAAPAKGSEAAPAAPAGGSLTAFLTGASVGAPNSTPWDMHAGGVVLAEC
jgi:hypothetical protein